MGPFSQYILKFEKLQVDGYGDNMPPPKLPTWKHGEEVWSSEFRDLIRDGAKLGPWFQQILTIY